MLRIGSFLMMVLLTAPMVRDCCLPVAHALPCHQSDHSAEVSCFAEPQAIAESKNTAALKLSIEYGLPADSVLYWPIFDPMLCAAHAAGLPGLAVTDIYLRTGALLI